MLGFSCVRADSSTLPDKSGFFTRIDNLFPTVCIRPSPQRTEVLGAGFSPVALHWITTQMDKIQQSVKAFFHLLFLQAHTAGLVQARSVSGMRATSMRSFCTA